MAIFYLSHLRRNTLETYFLGQRLHTQKIFAGELAFRKYAIFVEDCLFCPLMQLAAMRVGVAMPSGGRAHVAREAAILMSFASHSSGRSPRLGASSPWKPGPRRILGKRTQRGVSIFRAPGKTTHRGVSVLGETSENATTGSVAFLSFFLFVRHTGTRQKQRVQHSCTFREMRLERMDVAWSGDLQEVEQPD